MPKICPNCDKRIPKKAMECPHCGEDLVDEDDGNDTNPAQFLVPMNTSIWAIFSFYLGLLSCVPLLGLVVAIPAVILGIVALKKQPRKSSYGSVTGNVRAIIGITLGSIGLLLWGAMAVIMVIK